MGEARARGASGGGGGRGGAGGGGADAMLAAVAAEVAAVLDAPGAGAGVRCAAMEALLWLQARARSHQGRVGPYPWHSGHLEGALC
jgi:hypothetical protein